MRKLLLTSAAVTALLAAGSMANAQTRSEHQPPAASSQQNPDNAQENKKAKELNRAPERKETTGQAAPMNDNAGKAKAAGRENKSQNLQNEQKQNEPKQKSGASETKKGTTGSAVGSEKPNGNAAQKSGTSGTKSAQTGRKGRQTEGAQNAQPSGTSAEPKTGASTSKSNRSTSGQSPSGEQTRSGRSNQTNTPSAQGSQNPNATSGTSTRNNQPGSSQTNTSANSRTNGSTAVSSEAQAKFNQVIERQKVRSVNNVNFSVSVGTAIPRTVHVFDVPSDIVTINPQFRGKKFTVVRDEIVIIEPGTRKIVAVIPRSGRTTTGATTTHTTSTRLNLPPEKRRIIRETVIKEQAAPRCSDLTVTVGEDVPTSIRLNPFPDVVVREVPQIRSYQFCIKDNDVVLIDPSDHRIVDVID